MPQQFINQLQQVSRRRGRHRLWAATCWALVAMFAAGLALGMLDRLLGIADPIGRTLWTFVLFAGCALIARRWWFTVTGPAATPLQIAQEVERRHPQLRDIVSNAWEFGRQAEGDSTAGSESLRRAVVVHAVSATQDVDWRQLVERRPLRQAVFALASVGLAVGALGWYLPQSLGVGLTRLVNPLSLAEWPREHNLQFAQPPLLLAAGEDLVLQLRDTRGPLPETITMHYRMRRHGRWHEETKTLTTTAAPFEVRRPNVQESLEYRVTGADHRSMPWQRLEVLAAPRIESLEVTVHPPAYTKLPAQVWDKSMPIYAGSKLELRGRTNQPVTQVVAESSEGELTDAQVILKKCYFEINLPHRQINPNETYSLYLTTAVGLTVRSEKELALGVYEDLPPTVRLVEPAKDLAVVSTAVVPLVIDVSDEFAIREIALIYHRTDRADAGPLRVPLWSSKQTGAKAVKQHRTKILWQLEPLLLQPGTIIEVRAQASDVQTTTGQSQRALRLRVVSQRELWRQLVDQQAQVVETLTRLLRTQRELLGVTVDWGEFPEWSVARWVNASHATLFHQRQIKEALTGGRQSVLEQLAEMTETIERNRLLRPDAVDRLQAGQTVLQNLVDGPLTATEKSLSELTRQVQRWLNREKLVPWFSEIIHHQEQGIAGLQQAINLLLPGNVLGRLERELVTVQTEQADLTEHCRVELAPQLLQATIVDSQQQRVLRSAASRQRELAQRLTELMLDMSQASKRLADQAPMLAVRLAETGTLAEELRLEATIQSAADQLARRRLGRSTSLQQKTLRGLEKLVTHLAGRNVKDTIEQIERLQTLERELELLRREVATLEKKLLRPQTAQRELERLRRQRETLAARSEELTRQLEKLSLAKIAQATNHAASQLRQTKLDHTATKQARQQLDAAKEQLVAERRRQQVALARLQMAQLDTKLKTFVRRQQAIASKVVRLDDLHQKAGETSEAQQDSAEQLAELQVGLRAEVILQADGLATLPVFAHLLKVAGETMHQIEVRLQQNQLEQPTQELAEQAVLQLMQLSEEVGQQQQNLSANARRGQSGKGDGGDKAQEQTLQLTLGQLKLLRALQSTLREKTRNMEQRLATGKPLVDSGAALARQQDQLTQLARHIVSGRRVVSGRGVVSEPRAESLFPNSEQEIKTPADDLLFPKLIQENRP